MNRSFLCPSTPPYIGGGAEGFVMYKLQSPGDSLSSTRSSYKSLFLIQLYVSKLVHKWASGLHKLRVVDLQQTPGTFFGKPIGDAYVSSPRDFSWIEESGKISIITITHNLFESFYNSHMLYRDSGSWGWFIWRIRYQLTALVAIRKNLLQDQVPGHDLGILV